jgi:hypothetical protein
MSIKVVCDCGRTIRAKDALAGKSVRCPSCGQTVHILSTTEASAAAKPSPARAPVAVPWLPQPAPPAVAPSMPTMAASYTLPPGAFPPAYAPPAPQREWNFPVGKLIIAAVIVGAVLLHVAFGWWLVNDILAEREARKVEIIAELREIEEQQTAIAERVQSIGDGAEPIDRYDRNTDYAPGSADAVIAKATMAVEEMTYLQERMWDLAVKEGELREEAKDLGVVLPPDLELTTDVPDAPAEATRP